MSPMALVMRPSASSVRAAKVSSTSAFRSLSSVAVTSEEAFSATTPRLTRSPLAPPRGAAPAQAFATASRYLSTRMVQPESRSGSAALPSLSVSSRAACWGVRPVR